MDESNEPMASEHYDDEQVLSDQEEEEKDGDDYLSDYEYEDDECPPNFIDEEALAKAVDELNTETPETVAMKRVTTSEDSTVSQRRLAKDMLRILKTDTKDAGFRMEPVNDDSMHLWRIELFGFDKDSQLASDLHVCGHDSVVLNMQFPDDYPHAPPFVHLVSPRFERRTGHVIDGAICMELLTTHGWNPINDIEAVIVSIRSLLVSGRGRLEQAKQLSAKDYKKKLGQKRNQRTEADPKQQYTVEGAQRALQMIEKIHTKDWGKEVKK